MTQKLFDLNKLIQISLDEIIDAMFWCHHFFRWPRTYLCFTVWTLTQPSKCSSQLSGSLYVNFSELWWNHWKAGNNFLENQWWQDMKQISLMPRQGYKILISTLHISLFLPWVHRWGGRPAKLGTICQTWCTASLVKVVTQAAVHGRQRRVSLGRLQGAQVVSVLQGTVSLYQWIIHPWWSDCTEWSICMKYDKCWMSPVSGPTLNSNLVRYLVGWF